VNKYVDVAVSSVWEAIIFNVVGVIVALAVLILFHVSLGDSFGFIILILSTVLMLVGGALGVAGQATARKITEMLTRRKIDPKTVETSDLKAALYALTGIILFAEGAVMSVIFG
jgi:hypothetical protein